MYETPDQKEPTYEAKGIETVRRDGCPAVAKVNLQKKNYFILFITLEIGYRCSRKHLNCSLKRWTLALSKNIFVDNSVKFCQDELISRI